MPKINRQGFTQYMNENNITEATGTCKFRSSLPYTNKALAPWIPEHTTCRWFLRTNDRGFRQLILFPTVLELNGTHSVLASMVMDSYGYEMEIDM